MAAAAASLGKERRVRAVAVVLAGGAREPLVARASAARQALTGE
jgi:hypothetical protein